MKNSGSFSFIFERGGRLGIAAVTGYLQEATDEWVVSRVAAFKGHGQQLLKDVYRSSTGGYGRVYISRWTHWLL